MDEASIEKQLFTIYERFSSPVSLEDWENTLKESQKLTQSIEDFLTKSDDMSRTNKIKVKIGEMTSRIQEYDGNLQKDINDLEKDISDTVEDYPMPKDQGIFWGIRTQLRQISLNILSYKGKLKELKKELEKEKKFVNSILASSSQKAELSIMNVLFSWFYRDCGDIKRYREEMSYAQRDKRIYYDPLYALVIGESFKMNWDFEFALQRLEWAQNSFEQYSTYDVEALNTTQNLEQFYTHKSRFLVLDAYCDLAMLNAPKNFKNVELLFNKISDSINNLENNGKAEYLVPYPNEGSLMFYFFEIHKGVVASLDDLNSGLETIAKAKTALERIGCNKGAFLCDYGIAKALYLNAMKYFGTDRSQQLLQQVKDNLEKLRNESAKTYKVFKPEITFYLGKVYAFLGNPEKAKAHLESLSESHMVVCNKIFRDEMNIFKQLNYIIDDSPNSPCLIKYIKICFKGEFRRAVHMKINHGINMDTPEISDYVSPVLR